MAPSAQHDGSDRPEVPGELRDDAAYADGDWWQLPRGAEIETHVPTGIDVATPHTARMYDYFLGGKTNFAADRDAAERVIASIPGVVETARANRAFLARAIRHAAEQGMRQFLDIGTGIPAPGNTHEIAQSVAPESRVAYVDNDPIVLAHARALMAPDGRGRTTYVQADLREPEKILASPEVRDVIDFGRPVCVALISIMHFISAADDPQRIVGTLREALAPGSMLIVAQATRDRVDREKAREAVEIYATTSAGVTPRTHGEILAFFDGFELADPGLVRVAHWRPDGPPPTPAQTALIHSYGGVGVLT
jgi:SAM-dependent methyltransferase